ncbi:uncharacterized protein B0H18DRAFT_955318 [Fomitopsis serialis]|uniref:uncharacterized protein n=1 Tax=Fomitopsis serialis TaxID=139415 RepID=UPI0020079997|nr:uncharacterized protein B0H18DRAFT_955318 [Neoantrodia serialis]KAH9924930.1 hypothetical protein B0H18DRAFT_955318 [Neoantrodia serialis]
MSHLGILSPVEKVMRYLRINPVPEGGDELVRWIVGYKQLQDLYLAHRGNHPTEPHAEELATAVKDAMRSVIYTATDPPRGALSEMKRRAPRPEAATHQQKVAPIVALDGAVVKFGPPGPPGRKVKIVKQVAPSANADSEPMRREASGKRKATDMEEGEIGEGSAQHPSRGGGVGVCTVPRNQLACSWNTGERRYVTSDGSHNPGHAKRQRVEVLGPSKPTVDEENGVQAAPNAGVTHGGPAEVEHTATSTDGPSVTLAPGVETGEEETAGRPEEEKGDTAVEAPQDTGEDAEGRESPQPSDRTKRPRRSRSETAAVGGGRHTVQNDDVLQDIPGDEEGRGRVSIPKPEVLEYQAEGLRAYIATLDEAEELASDRSQPGSPSTRLAVEGQSSRKGGKETSDEDWTENDEAQPWEGSDDSPSSSDPCEPLSDEGSGAEVDSGEGGEDSDGVQEHLRMSETTGNDRRVQDVDPSATSAVDVSALARVMKARLVVCDQCLAPGSSARRCTFEPRSSVACGNCVKAQCDCTFQGLSLVPGVRSIATPPDNEPSSVVTVPRPATFGLAVTQGRHSDVHLPPLKRKRPQSATAPRIPREYDRRMRLRMRRAYPRSATGLAGDETREDALRRYVAKHTMKLEMLEGQLARANVALSAAKEKEATLKRNLRDCERRIAELGYDNDEYYPLPTSKPTSEVDTDCGPAHPLTALPTIMPPHTKVATGGTASPPPRPHIAHVRKVLDAIDKKVFAVGTVTWQINGLRLLRDALINYGVKEDLYKDRTAWKAKGDKENIGEAVKAFATAMANQKQPKEVDHWIEKHWSSLKSPANAIPVLPTRFEFDEKDIGNDKGVLGKAKTVRVSEDSQAGGGKPEKPGWVCAEAVHGKCDGEERGHRGTGAKPPSSRTKGHLKCEECKRRRKGCFFDNGSLSGYMSKHLSGSTASEPKADPKQQKKAVTSDAPSAGASKSTGYPKARALSRGKERATSERDSSEEPLKTGTEVARHTPVHRAEVRVPGTDVDLSLYRPVEELPMDPSPAALLRHYQKDLKRAEADVAAQVHRTEQLRASVAEEREILDKAWAELSELEAARKAGNA